MGKKTTITDKSQKKSTQTIENFKFDSQNEKIPRLASINFQESENDETYNISHYTTSDSGNYSIVQNISIFL